MKQYAYIRFFAISAALGWQLFSGFPLLSAHEQHRSDGRQHSSHQERGREPYHHPVPYGGKGEGVRRPHANINVNGVGGQQGQQPVIIDDDNTPQDQADQIYDSYQHPQ